MRRTTDATELTAYVRSDETPRIRRRIRGEELVVAVPGQISVDNVPAQRPAGAGVAEITMRAQLVERLLGEFGDRFAVDHVRRVVDLAFASLSSARVRTFVSVLAWRRARADLRSSVPIGRLDTPA